MLYLKRGLDYRENEGQKGLLVHTKNMLGHLYFFPFCFCYKIQRNLLLKMIRQLFFGVWLIGSLCVYELFYRFIPCCIDVSSSIPLANVFRPLLKKRINLRTNLKVLVKIFLRQNNLNQPDLWNVMLRTVIRQEHGLIQQYQQHKFPL